GVEWVAQEACAAAGHVDVRYDASGVRFQPYLHLLPLSGSIDDWPLNASDVLLVTGGGKGIAAECALSLARKTHAALLLLGRSDPRSAEHTSELQSRFVLVCRLVLAEI